MKKITLFLVVITIAILLFGFSENAFSQKATIELTFTAENNGQNVPLNSILIENLTQGGDTILYAPNNMLSLEYSLGVNEFDLTKSLFSVSQNYPNPFRNYTSIQIYFPDKDNLEICIYDLMGKKIHSYSDQMGAGTHQFEFYPGIENTYVLAAKWNNETRFIKMICLSSNRSNEAKITYKGSIAEQPIFKNKPRISNNNLKNLDNQKMPDAITIVPSNTDGYEEITLTFDPAKACFESGSLVGLSSIAIHSGVKLATGEAWVYHVPFDATGVNGQATTLLPNGDGRFKITFTPSSFYGLTGQNITHICAVFNNGNNWEQDGRDVVIGSADCLDFFIPLSSPFNYDLGDELKFTAFTNLGESSIIDSPTGNKTYTFQIETGTPCPVTPTVSYQGQIYNTVLIGNQCWLKENLNTGTMINGVEWMTNNSIIEKYCYDNNPSNCETYGGLYIWDEMMEYTTVQGSQGICPPGWHIPTDEEWCTATQHIDATVDCNVMGWSGTDVGIKMKSSTGWDEGGNGSNSSGFTGVPSGYVSNIGDFETLGERAYFWSSTISDADHSYYRRLHSSFGSITREDGGIYYGNSVRCLKDETTSEIPSPPSNLSATAVSSSQINLSWADNSNNETGFKIERSINGISGWSVIFTTTANTTSHQNTGLNESTTYYYRAMAFNSSGNSNYSNTAQATTFTPTSEIILAGPATATGLYELIWTYTWPATGSYDDHYELEHSYSETSGYLPFIVYDNEDRTSPYTQILYPEAVDIGKTSYFRVRAKVNGSYTQYSNVVGVYTPYLNITFNPIFDNSLGFDSNDPNFANSVNNNNGLIVGSSYFWFGSPPLLGAWLNTLSALFFDIDNFIEGRTITNAILTLRVAEKPDDSDRIYYAAPIETGWNTNTLCFDNMPDYYGNLAVGQYAPTSNNIAWQIDITSIVQAWANGTIPNNGFYILDDWPVYPYGENKNYIGEFYCNETASQNEYKPQLYLEIE